VGATRGWGKDFFFFPFIPNMFLLSSQVVPIKFPICSPRVFPIAPHFYPILRLVKDGSKLSPGRF
jgi:hypothetical protein